MTKYSLWLVLMGFLPLALGCSKSKEDDEENAVAELCREQCTLSADACPDGSLGSETEEFCSFLCLVYEDSDSCAEKFEDYMVCLADNEPACELFDTVPACDDLAAPFLIDGTDAGMHGECVDEEAVE